MASISAEMKSDVFKRVRGTVSPREADIFEKCFVDTLSSTVKIDPDDTAFMVTGDIPAMWLRDSTWQLFPYLHFLNEDENLRHLAQAVSRKQQAFILIDPYANAFNAKPNNAGHQDDVTVMGPQIWERKYEIDSLCAPLLLAFIIWKETGDTSHLDRFKEVLQAVIQTWRTEQDHEKNSHYTFERIDPFKSTDTMVRNGKGPLVAPTGMTWSGFRPSDDATTYGYNIPANAFADMTLRYSAELVSKVWGDEQLRNQALKLSDELAEGIRSHGRVQSSSGETVYAYEADGLGNHLLMDDANIPSLLSLPLFGWAKKDDAVYASTRKSILSAANPFWYKGSAAQGIGSPHTPEHYVWPISLSVQGLTSTQDTEKREILDLLSRTDAGTGLMHESFDVNDPGKFTRPWFSWSNAMYCELVLEVCGFADLLANE